MVRIFWESKITGHTGNGTRKMTEDEAKPLVKSLNQEYPQLKHWYQ